MSLLRPLGPVGCAGLAAGLAASVVLLGGPAFAHVSVNPSTAQQGGYTKLTFRVPVESETASTTKVEVAFPTDTPITSVRTKPVPGWKAVVETSGEAVSQVTWTADSAASALKPSEFGEFDVSVGPLPKAETITFKAVQSYSDGTVVRWIETSPDSTGSANSSEPEHPAPVLTLTPASGEGHHGASPAADSHGATGAAAPAHATEGEESTAESRTPLVLSITALVVAVLSAGVSLRRRRG